MEYVKKQTFGGIRTCDKDEATHVLQTVSDYGEMVEIASMYRDLSRKDKMRQQKRRRPALQASEKTFPILYENKTEMQP